GPVAERVPAKIRKPIQAPLHLDDGSPRVRYGQQGSSPMPVIVRPATSHGWRAHIQAPCQSLAVSTAQWHEDPGRRVRPEQVTPVLPDHRRPAHAELAFATSISQGADRHHASEIGRANGAWRRSPSTGYAL